jgi:RNA polymerase sigma factor (TIGR02999 family)
MTGSPPDATEITALLEAVGAGDRLAVDRLFERVYGELRRIARGQLAGAPRAETLNTTALVHEAYLKLSRGARWSTRDRAHFFALTAQAMRQVLVDHARKRMRTKRGGGKIALTLDEIEVPVEQRADELVALDAALEKLEAADPELARLVEQRFFAGLSVEEIAELRDVSDRTVKRHWRLARAFLFDEMAAAGWTT